MKKLVLFLTASLILSSCSIENDGPRIAADFAEVTEIELPEFFEQGKTYEIKVTYLLPTACHTAAGLEVKRGNAEGPGRRDIYVAGVATYDQNVVTCNRQSEDLEKTAKFAIGIDEEDPYTFYLWTGLDNDLENEFTIIEVPVVGPGEPNPGE
ncbi:hypothetical protein FK178_09015 [Antarcticibacterium arcticum]|uniref:Lipoprotein n=1 Tax=Antarcticibacterium arcticum TaxID=2585771 RepID=A0A5B8YJB3_9FLAO|nr:membrane lipoprotein lipid attachment site-containing protein [Antarcticibacterium arcticum]QED37854.1 hypothetical protein FK178_09015 [Antarcticibacterium arcticum]